MEVDQMKNAEPFFATDTCEHALRVFIHLRIRAAIKIQWDFLRASFRHASWGGLVLANLTHEVRSKNK